MRNAAFILSLKELAAEYDTIGQALFEQANAIATYPKHDPGDRLYSLDRIAERSTVQLRHLAACAAPEQKSAFYAGLPSLLGISVEEERLWIKITVPSILPNRSGKDNSEFLMRPLRNSLTEFQRTNQMPKFRDCMICIVHGYDEALGQRRIRDYDNIETKRYLDVIESALLTNDSSLLCSVLQTTEILDRDCTQFFLMQPETLQTWSKIHIRTKT